MKHLSLMLLLGSAAVAEPVGFSPTMPFGIPARTTVSPVNTGGPPQAFRYDPYGYYYYYGGGVSGYAGQGYPSGQGGNIPGYHQSLPQRDLPVYSNSANNKRKSDQLPGYNRP